MGKNITKNWDVKKKYLTPVSLIKSSLADGSRLSGGHRITDTGMRISLLGLFIANVVSRARLSRKSQQEPSSMGLLGEALFLFLGELLGLRETLPRQARIASWQARTSQTVPAFSLCEAAWALARDPLEKSFADRGERGMIALEGRRSSFRGRMGPCGNIVGQAEANFPIWLGFGALWIYYNILK